MNVCVAPFRSSNRRVLSSWGVHIIRTVKTKAEEIRLTKRMSQLDMASRREADRLIHDNKVLVKGVPATVGMKVPSNETDIVISGMSERKAHAVVLNKPVGYVSGQPEHNHLPAVKLLTRENGDWRCE